jgi:hypothetical protein
MKKNDLCTEQLNFYILKYRVCSRVVMFRGSPCEVAGSNLAPAYFFEIFFFLRNFFFHSLKTKNFIKFQFRQYSLVVLASLFLLSRSWVRFLLFFGFSKIIFLIFDFSKNIFRFFFSIRFYVLSS